MKQQKKEKRKQVVNNLNKIRQKYKEFKKTWDDGEI